MTNSDAPIEAVIGASLTEEALIEVLRGWHLESVGQVSHNDAASIAEAILASPAFRAIVAGERAAALREAADDSAWEYFGDVSRMAVRRWLRKQADRETP